MNKIFTRNASKLTSQIYLHSSNKISFSPNENSLIIGQFDGDITKANFVENPEFKPKFQEVVKHKIYDDFAFIMEAGISQSSFMPIYDFRNIPRYQRVPEIGDIFGYLLVDENGKMVRDSYEPNAMYVTYGDRLIKLSDYLLEEVRKL